MLRVVRRRIEKKSIDMFNDLKARGPATVFLTGGVGVGNARFMSVVGACVRARARRGATKGSMRVGGGGARRRPRKGSRGLRRRRLGNSAIDYKARDLKRAKLESKTLTLN